MDKKEISNNPDNVESLIHTAKHGSILHRKDAIRGLGETRDKRAIPPLVEILKTEFQSGEREAAADSLEKLGWKPVNDVDKAYLLIARRSWKELAQLGAKYLILALKWPNEREVTPYFVGMGKAAREPLIEALESRDYNRHAIAMVLGELGDKKAAAPLAQILKEQSAWYDLKNKVAQTLNKLGYEPRDDVEKAYLLIAAKRWGEAAELGEPAVEPLIQVLRRFGWPEAREALVRIGKPAVEPLIQSLGEHATWARFQAATALGEIGDRKALEPLTQLLNSEKQEQIKEAAKKSIRKNKDKNVRSI